MHIIILVVFNFSLFFTINLIMMVLLERIQKGSGVMKQPVTCSTLMKIKSVSQPTYASGEVYFVETWIDQKG